MTIKNIAKEGSKATVQIQIDSELLEKGKTEAYKKVKNSIQLPGFRKGKAPRKMVESMYGADVFLEDAVNEIFPFIYEAMIGQGLKIVGMPAVEKTDMDDEGLLQLTIVAPLYPEVTLGQYKGLEVTKAEASVSESEIDAEIERMAMNVARLETVERVAQDGDTANIDYEGFIDGVAFEGGKAEGQDLKLGSGTFIPGFEEQVIGMCAGEERDINVTFPENYHADMAGKDACFHIKLNAVKELIKPELDDEFAKDVSEAETMAELREITLKRMEADKEKAVNEGFTSAVIEAAYNNMEADIPEAMVDEEIDYQLKQVEYQLRMSGMTMEQYEQMFGGKAQICASMRPTALAQVKTHILLTEVAKAENIEVTAEELEAEYTKLQDTYNMDIEAIKQRLPAETVEVELRNRKTTDLIVSSAIATAPAAEAAEAEAE